MPMPPRDMPPAPAAPPADSPATAPRRRTHGRSTLQHIADAVGVTKVTVSRYLREPHRVAPATAERIARALAEQGYMPNRQAGMLASGRSRVVAAIVPSLANSVFADTVQGLAEGLQSRGYELLLAATGYSPTREEQQIRAVLGWSPDALAVTGRQHTDAARALLQAAANAGTPIIEMWDWQPRATAFAQVGFNHAEVGRAMARHLTRAGYRALAYVDTGVAADFRAHERGKAFLGAARAVAGVQAQLLTATAGDAFEAGREAVTRLLDSRGRIQVDAIAFANDHLACGAYLEAERRGIAVPAQVALMGFGDFPLTRQLGAGITSVRPPRYEIGRETAAMILRRLGEAGEGAEEGTGAVAWTLMERGSTAPRRVAAVPRLRPAG
jgi:LacI family gluconate utilization system Gnt-I transcriptional repressor